MEIEISVSNHMDEAGHRGDSQEHGRIRMSKEYRKRVGFDVGAPIYLRNRFGELDIYKVSAAYEDDESINPNCAYVTSHVHKRLFLKDRKTGDIDKVENITLGCDPEAVLVDTHTGRIIPAHTLFKKYGNVGHDGQLIEFRPNPSIYAEEVCGNLWGLIQKARAQLNQTDVGRRAIIFGCSAYGSENNNVTAGFHLHYGFPPGMIGRSRDVRCVARLIVKVFDYYVGIPSILPEGNKDTYRRTKKFVDYGKPGGFNIDNRTFEFRLPGGINLVHPILTRGLLALGAVVAEDIASRVNTCTDHFIQMTEISTLEDLYALYPNIPSVENFYTAICTPDIGNARNYFGSIKEDVRKMVGYTKRAEGVEAYFALIDSGTTFNSNIETNWGGFYNHA